MFKYFIIQPLKNKPGHKLDKFLETTKNELYDFFNINVEHPYIFFLNSRKDIDKIWNKKTESWLCAWAKNGDIFILNPKIYAKESNHEIKHFWQTIKHEYCHLYFNKLTGVTCPKWLNEGLACYLAGQIKKTPTQDEAMKVFEYFEKNDREIYSIGYFWVKILIKKFGKKVFLKFLKELKPGLNERKFRIIFYKVYKIKFSKNSLSILFQDGVLNENTK